MAPTNSNARTYLPDGEKLTLTPQQREDMELLQSKGGLRYGEALLSVTAPKRKIRAPKMHELEKMK